MLPLLLLCFINLEEGVIWVERIDPLSFRHHGTHSLVSLSLLCCLGAQVFETSFEDAVALKVGNWRLFGE
jgi:hypothetical protein